MKIFIYCHLLQKKYLCFFLLPSLILVDMQGNYLMTKMGTTKNS